MDANMTFQKLLPLAAVLAMLGLPATAQDNTATEEAQDPAAELDMGTPVDEDGNPVAGEPQVGQQYVREEHGDWVVRCLRTEEGDDPCQIYQLLSDDEGNDVAEISMVSLPEGQAAAGATIVAPLGTLLTEQLTLRVDGGTARRFQFSTCNQGGCIARVGFTAEDVGLFKAGAAATLRLVPFAAPDQEVILTISLSGFTAAFDAL
ncbi:invasion associated locus B family protein [Salibaculum griseiflavum]|jgi:invasion protein IalB|uniref:Invasion associated locus B family protein n=2 Tax=Salibaculum griseiflavum TaxID=1914409 RepID=A0A2V1P532_9RHOB|nr:invasion associated locus B family protein [Salibaculum griseiflavum]